MNRPPRYASTGMRMCLRQHGRKMAACAALVKAVLASAGPRRIVSEVPVKPSEPSPPWPALDWLVSLAPHYNSAIAQPAPHGPHMSPTIARAFLTARACPVLHHTRGDTARTSVYCRFDTCLRCVSAESCARGAILAEERPTCSDVIRLPRP